MSKRFHIILWNILPFAVYIILFGLGGVVSLYMPLPLLLITVMNVIRAGSKKEFLMYNAVLLLSSVAGILGNSQLYFKYVCYDMEGVIVMQAEILVAVVFILICTAVEFLIRYFYDKKSKALS